MKAHLLYIKYLKISLIGSLLLSSCIGQREDDFNGGTVVNIPVNVDDAILTLGDVNKISDEAQEIIRVALVATCEAKKEAVGAKELVKKMEDGKSPFTKDVTILRNNYEKRMTNLNQQLNLAQSALTRQKQKVAELFVQLETAKRVSELSEKEKQILRSQNDKLAAMLKEADKYKEKYLKLTKYRWIVIGMGVWLALKFVGGLGAWSPQGRIAKMLIG